MNVLVSHPSGNTFVRALLSELGGRGQLGGYATTLGFSGKPHWFSLLPKGLRAELERRSYSVKKSELLCRPAREGIRLLAARSGWRRLTRHERGWACVDAVYQDLDAAVARRLPEWQRTRSLDAVYTYEDGALETLTRARSLGMQAAYDLPIAYWETVRRLLAEESDRLPEWSRTLDGAKDSEKKLERKTAEMEAAELVICPSQFVLDSIPESLRAGRRCVVAEFGSPPVVAGIRNDRKMGEQPLRVLFAGSMGQRKGLADLFAAMNLLKRSDVELVVMGSLLAPLEFYRSHYAGFIYEPPRPHAAVLALMQTCDVFCLPSIVEGRALVQQEALACGLPLIVTCNAGAADLIDENITGKLVPIRSPQAIATAISWFADNRGNLRDLSYAAKAKAETVSWNRYARIILDALGGSLTTDERD